MKLPKIVLIKRFKTHVLIQSEVHMHTNLAQEDFKGEMCNFCSISMFETCQKTVIICW